MEISIVCCENNIRKNQISRAKEILNGVQSYFYYTLKMENIEVCKTIETNWNSFCNKHMLGKNEYIIYITENPFDDNWFLHVDYQYAIISICDWEEMFAPPSLRAYLVRQIAVVTMGFITDLNENVGINMFHEPAEGCLFDLCIDKTDIKLSMISGIICSKCRSVLLQYGIDEKIINSIENMLAYVRSEAIGKPMIYDHNAAFIVMRFSINDENDNAYKYGIKNALNELNIRCVRADEISGTGQLLEKIKRNIEKNRFVIAKVDSENLNVYFELGLAMGLNKDVLLISEKDLILQLPSDLKNWECLTYSKGNYEELKEKVVKYYKENFHY